MGDVKHDRDGSALALSLNGYLSPPNIFSCPPEPRFHEFIADANSAFQKAYPKPTTSDLPRYSKVFALLIRWEEDDLGVITEVEKLKRVFSERYGYETALFDIPEHQSQRKLNDRVMELIENVSEDHLLIVYYGGHSEFNQQHLIWRR
jgi:Caspase domain